MEWSSLGKAITNDSCFLYYFVNYTQSSTMNMTTLQPDNWKTVAKKMQIWLQSLEPLKFYHIYLLSNC